MTWTQLVSYYDRKHPIEGYKIYQNKNIYFVGMNLPYYGFLTEDRDILDMLGGLFMTAPGKTIKRETVTLKQLNTDSSGATLDFDLPEDMSNRDLIMPLAFLDNFKISVTGSGEYVVQDIHNLIGFRGEGGRYKMQIVTDQPSETRTGAIISALGLIACLLIWGAKRLFRRVKPVVTVMALLALFLLLFFPWIAVAAERIEMDGNFDEWAVQVYVADPQGDIMNVSDQTQEAGDTKRLYWGTNSDDDDSNLYFSVIRYQTADNEHKMTGKEFFDIDNDGDYEGQADDLGSRSNWWYGGNSH